MGPPAPREGDRYLGRPEASEEGLGQASTCSARPETLLLPLVAWPRAPHTNWPKRQEHPALQVGNPGLRDALQLVKITQPGSARAGTRAQVSVRQDWFAVSSGLLFPLNVCPSARSPPNLLVQGRRERDSVA